jgi:dihydroorotate dehydrogenase
MIYRTLRPLLFRIDPERAHHLALQAVRMARPLLRWRRFPDVPVEVFGLRFSNPVGLAAGYDKDATAWRGLARLGFGHIEIGTVTPRPQPGNPRPRVFRLPEHRALVNRMGFPGDGADAVAARLRGRRPEGLILGVSMGPNADTPPRRRGDDYLALVDRFAPLTDYLALNVSSPNTEGLRALESADRLGHLLGPVVTRCREWRERLGHPLPLLVKLSPDLDDPAASIRAAEDAGADGIVIANTTTSRPGGVGEDLDGGLSGAPLGPLAEARLRTALETTALPVVASGGITRPEEAAARLAAGAALVQIYSGLAFEGPGLVGAILDRLAADS